MVCSCNPLPFLLLLLLLLCTLIKSIGPETVSHFLLRSFTIHTYICCILFSSLFDIIGLDLTGMQGVCFLNIKSFGGGINFWGHQPAEPNFREPQYDDQLLEVIGFRSSLHMGQIQIGVTMPHRLAQGRHIIVRTQGPLPFQVDGEPWGVKSACEVHVSLRTQTLMLTPAADEKESAVVSAFSNLMHWAEETRVITDAQKATLMREFAKRHAKIAPSSAFYQPVLTSGNDYD